MGTKADMKKAAQIIAPRFKQLHEREVYRSMLKSEIEKRFHEQRCRARFWERFKIRIQIAREVENEFRKKYPPSAMYSTAA